MKKKYKSEILHMIHDEARANYEVGAITKAEFEEYSRTCIITETPAISNAQNGTLSSRKGRAAPVYALKK